MAHFNESWDLPPLLGSCYMYGPLKDDPTLKEVKELLLKILEKLERHEGG
jgi:hypothetical protein